MQTSAFAKVFTDNDQSAAAVRSALRGSSVLAINVVGAAGVGKTTLIEQTLQRLPHLHSAVIVSNPAPRRDAHRLMHYFDHVVPVASSSLAATHVAAILRDLDLNTLDLLFIESSATSTYPVDLDLGQDLRVGVFSVSGGDDKAEQRPALVRESDAVVLTKVDLLPYVPFDLGVFRSDVHRLNPSAELIEVSSLRFNCLERWITWLELHREEARSRRAPSDTEGPTPEWYFG